MKLALRGFSNKGLAYGFVAGRSFALLNKSNAKCDLAIGPRSFLLGDSVPFDYSTNPLLYNSTNYSVSLSH